MAIILIRTLIIFTALVLAMRLLGKRQLGEMELSELVVAVLVADIAVNPLQDTDMPLIYGLVPLLVLFCCEIIISGLTLKRRTALCIPSTEAHRIFKESISSGLISSTAQLMASCSIICRSSVLSAAFIFFESFSFGWWKCSGRITAAA